MTVFEDVLYSLLHIENVDIYVTGSNSKFFSKDVITAFLDVSTKRVQVYPTSSCELAR